MRLADFRSCYKIEMKTTDRHKIKSSAKHSWKKKVGSLAYYTTTSTMDQAEEEEEEIIRVRIISVGDVCTGKSCLVKKYCAPSSYQAKHIPTIGVDYGVKNARKQMNDGKTVDVALDFFDLSGDQHYDEVRNELYSAVDGVLLVFDVTRNESFESLNGWLDELRRYGISSDNTTMVVVGNKIDKNPRQVSEQEGTSYAIEHNLSYFETSAKTGGESIDDMFDFIIQDTLKKGFYK